MGALQKEFRYKATDPHRLDDGTVPSQKVLEYIAQIHPEPIRFPNRSIGQVSMIYPKKSFYIIQSGELSGLQLIGSQMCAKGEFVFPSLKIAPRLKFLYLHDVPFASFENFPAYPYLQECSIRNSEIKTLLGMPSEFPALEILLLECPHLLDLEGFPRTLPSLKKLSLQNSDLRFLKPFPCEAPNLEGIDVTGCQFRDFTFWLVLAEFFQKSIKYGNSASVPLRDKSPWIIWVNFTHLPALRSIDGFRSLAGQYPHQIPSYVGRIVSRHKDQFPPFVQLWVSLWEEIRAREFEYPEGRDYHNQTGEDEDNYMEFSEQKDTDLRDHIYRLAAHHRQNLPQLLDAVMHADPPTNWPNDFSPELIQRVIHECTPKERHHVLDVLPKKHPLHGLWKPNSVAKITLPDSHWDIVL